MQNELATSEALQEMNDIDATLSASNNQKENEQSSDVTPGTAENSLKSLKLKNESTDSYFLFLKLANQLKEKQTNLLGTINKIRREAPLPLRNMKEKLYSCKLYKCGNTTLTVYQGKVNKHMLILSTMHNNITIADNSKKTPETVSSYNQTKYRVNVLDQMAKKYTCRTGT